jgi:hypothetical protein
MRAEEKSALVASIFSDEITFEKLVLDIQNEADRKEVMGLLSDEIVSVKLRDRLHFSYLKSYDDLHTEDIVKIILQRLTSETALYLEEKLQYTHVMTMETIKKTPNLLFLKRMSLFYFKRFGHLVFEKIADTLFEKIASLPTEQNPPQLLLDVITGTSKHPPLIKGNVVAFKHVWEHARKAYLARKKEMGKVQIALTSILNLKEESEGLTDDQQRQLGERYAMNQKELETIRKKPLELFDGSLRRMKSEIVHTLQER